MNEPVSDSVASNSEAVLEMIVDSNLPAPCRQAMLLGRQFEQKKWELAEALATVRRDKLWKALGCGGFDEFVEDHVRMKLRTAQELIRLVERCHELGISRTLIDSLGWTKLATVVSSMTPENAAEVLKDVRTMSVDALRQRYRGQSSRAKAKPRDTVQWTESMERALRRAARHTLSDDAQQNLEFVCQQFCEFYPVAASRIPWPGSN